jgi:hypothetical protein
LYDTDEADFIRLQFVESSTHYMGHHKTEYYQINIIACPFTFINDVCPVSLTLICLMDEFTIYIIGDDLVCLMVVSACLQGSEVPSSI